MEVSKEQICKYSEKTRRRVTELSTEAILKVDFATDQNIPIDPAVSGRGSNINPTSVRGQQGSLRAKSYGTTKRAVCGNDRLAFGTSTKKVKVSQATTLGKNG